MSKSVKVSASILSADFSKLGEEIKKCENAGVDMIHVDVMDGHFVPNITIGQVIVRSVRSVTTLPVEAHLMIENPWAYIDDFITQGADILAIHAECYGQRRPACREFGQYPKEVDTIDVPKLRADLKRIRGKGAKAFVVINPGTPACFEELYSDIDGVLIMSVNPGFANQKFISSVLPKAELVRRNFSGDIAIDGGINAETAPAAVKAGVNILATASYFFGSADPGKAVSYLKSLGANPSSLRAGI